MVPWEDWAEIFEDREWINIGAGPRRYPEDMVALYQWQDQLMKHIHVDLSSPSPGSFGFPATSSLKSTEQDIFSITKPIL
jgi:hypothetical protein